MNDGDAADDFSFAAPGPAIVPYLAYGDAAAAIAFLTEVLGFEILSRYDGPDGGVLHAELHFDDGIIMLGSLAKDRSDDAPSGRIGTYVVVDDVEAHHARAMAAGLGDRGGTLLYGPQATEFGTRRYRLRDPEGHEWSFGTIDRR